MRKDEWRILADDLTGAGDAALAFLRPRRRVRVHLGAGPHAAGDGAGKGATGELTGGGGAAKGTAGPHAAGGGAGKGSVDAWSCGWRDDVHGAAAFAALLPATPEHLLIKVDSTLRGPVAEMIAACRHRWPDVPLVFTPALPVQGRIVRTGRLWVAGAPAPPRPDLPPLADAESDADLARLVAGAPAGALFVGSSGLAAALAGASPPSPPAGTAEGPRVLVVAGSDHPATRAQLARVRDPVVYDAEAGARRAPDFPALVLTGGRTAAACLRALGLTAFEVVGAAGAGIPVGRAGPWLLATKAGGFGDTGALARTCDVLRTYLRRRD